MPERYEILSRDARLEYERRILAVEVEHSDLVKAAIALLRVLDEWEHHPPNIITWRTTVHQARSDLREAMPEGYDSDEPPASLKGP